MPFCAVLTILGYTYGQLTLGRIGLLQFDYQVFISKIDCCINKKLYICECYSKIMVLFDRCTA